MEHLLIWLALPLLAAPFVARRGHVAGTAGQLVLAGLGLAAFWQGAGSLDPRDLHSIALQSPHDAWFVGLTSGAMITGAVLLPDFADWRRLATGVPVLGALVFIGTGSWLPLLLGGIIGAIPAVAGPMLWPWREDDEPTGTVDWPTIILAALAIVALLVAPLLVAVPLLIFFGWWCGSLSGWRRAAFWLPAGAATLALTVWSWLALTIAGAGWSTLASFARDAPVSLAAGQWLAILVLAWGAALVAAGQATRGRRGQLLLLPVVVAIWLASGGSTADGMAHWEPVVSTAGVLLAILALIAAWPRVLMGVLALLAATHAGPLAIAAALLAAFFSVLWPATVPPRLLAVVGGVSAALVVVVLLRDEVLLALLLAIALTVTVNRPWARVAPA